MPTNLNLELQRRELKMKIRKIINRAIENWPAKILSFAFALVLMQFYKSSLLEKKYFSVPLVIENTGDLVIASSIPRIIKVSVWGNKTDLAPIKEDDIIAWINISEKKKEGKHQIPIKTKIKGISEDIGSLEINVLPANLKVQLEKTLSKSVPVKLSLRGSPMKNYEIYESEFDPETIELTGPYSKVSEIEEVFTTPISIDKRRSSFSGTVDIFNANPMVKIIGSSKIDYSIKIREEKEMKEYTNLNILFDNLNPELQIVSEIPKGKVIVQGTKSILKNWIPPASVLKVKCDNIKKPGTYTLPVQAIIPGRLRRVDADPKNIKIEVKRIKINFNFKDTNKTKKTNND